MGAMNDHEQPGKTANLIYMISKTRYQEYLDLDIRQVIFLNIYIEIVNKQCIFYVRKLFKV